MKIIFKIVKKIIISICLVYGFDMVANGIGIFIPINIFTILIVSSLGMSGLIALVGVFFLI